MRTTKQSDCMTTSNDLQREHEYPNSFLMHLLYRQYIEKQ